MQTQSKSLSQQRLLMSVGAAMECRIRNDRQSCFALARELAHAQFILADSVLSCRLWQDVADRELDVARLLHLLYGGWDVEDDAEMLEADQHFLSLKVV